MTWSTTPESTPEDARSCRERKDGKRACELACHPVSSLDQDCGTLAQMTCARADWSLAPELVTVTAQAFGRYEP